MSATRSTRYLRLADEYGRAATHLFDRGGAAQSPNAFFHLVGHSIELALKSVIAAGPCSDEDLISLGHDLSFCLHVANATGLVFDNAVEHEAVVRLLGGGHHAQGFRYPTLLQWAPPHPEVALKTLWALIDAATGHTSGASTDQSDPRPK